MYKSILNFFGKYAYSQRLLLFLWYKVTNNRMYCTNNMILYILRKRRMHCFLYTKAEFMLDHGVSMTNVKCYKVVIQHNIDKNK